MEPNNQPDSRPVEVRLERDPNVPEPVKYPWDYDPSLNGLGGWMLIVIIFRFLTILSGMLSIAGVLALDAFTLSLLPGYVTFCIIWSVLVEVIWSVVILIFIFQRAIAFRLLFVIQICLSLLVAFGTWIYAAGWGLEPEYRDIVFTIIGGVIWIVYLYKSNRVKNTFIYPNQYPEPDDAWYGNTERYE